MSDLEKIILSSAGFSAMFCAGIIWLFRSWISECLKNAIRHEYEQKLETHKAQLKAQSDVEIEKLKSQLQIAANERNVKLTRVFEFQAKAIAEIYANLHNVMQAVSEYTSIMEFKTMPPLEERRKAVGEALVKFFKHYRPNQIYVPTENKDMIGKFANELNNKAMDFMFNVEQGLEKRRPAEERDTWMKTYEWLKTDCTKMLEELDKEFKKILGLDKK